MVVRLLLRFTLPHFVDVHAGAYLQNVNVCVYAQAQGAKATSSSAALAAKEYVRPQATGPTGPLNPVVHAAQQQQQQQQQRNVAQKPPTKFTPSAKLPLQGTKSLGKVWQKFVHIMRWGKVVKEVSREPVQQISLAWLWGGGFSSSDRDTLQLTDKEREQLSQVCTEGAPSCTMRLKNGEERSGPLFQLQVVVQVPGKGLQQDTRNICFSEGVALLEKPLQHGRVHLNARFAACSRRCIKFRDVESLGDEAAGAAAAAPTATPAAPLTASCFKWRGKQSAQAPMTQHESSCTRLSGGENAKITIPSAFKWCNKGAVPICAVPDLSSGVGKKRGREDEGGDVLSQQATKGGAGDVSVLVPAKRMRIGQISLQGQR